VCGVRAVQFMSAACRAARSPKLSDLPSAQLLRQINDNDVALCRETRRSKLGLVASILIGIPTLLALTHESIQEAILDVVIPTLWSCFVIANSYLLSWSLYALIIPYALLALYLLHRQFVIIPRKQRRLAEKKGTWSGSHRTRLSFKDRLRKPFHDFASSLKERWQTDSHSRCTPVQAQQWKHMNAILAPWAVDRYYEEEIRIGGEWNVLDDVGALGGPHELEVLRSLKRKKRSASSASRRASQSRGSAGAESAIEQEAAVAAPGPGAPEELQLQLQLSLGKKYHHELPDEIGRMTIDHTKFTIKDRSSRHRSTKAVNKYIWGTSATLRDASVPADPPPLNGSGVGVGRRESRARARVLVAEEESDSPANE
jgi:hypothetical protein